MVQTIGHRVDDNMQRMQKNPIEKSQRGQFLDFLLNILFLGQNDPYIVPRVQMKGFQAITFAPSYYSP